MSVKLDRMEIEEAGPNPDHLAAAIHAQLGQSSGAVPVRAIAEALDIVEIRTARLSRLEGALVMPPDRNVGSILLNENSGHRRRRFTLAHELLHFLNPWHRPAEHLEGFACTKADMTTAWGRPPAGAARHKVQEAEANRFAIELLAPRKFMRRYLGGIPDLAKVIAVSDDLDISREAAARRYVDFKEEPTALVFSLTGVVRYVYRSDDFPFVACEKGQRISSLPGSVDTSGLSTHEEADPRDWLLRPNDEALVVQTLSQAEGYSISLLAIDASEDDSGVDD